MWKTVFGDPDAYMDIYFRDKYRNENTLVYIEDGKPVASLQMLPYMFTFCEKEIPIAYISGACTLPAYRGKGYMSALLKQSFQEMRKRNIPLTLLVPQDAGLMEFYAPFGFAQAFDAGTEAVAEAQRIAGRGGLVVVTGSLFIVGEVRTIFELPPGHASRVVDTERETRPAAGD